MLYVCIPFGCLLLSIRLADRLVLLAADPSIDACHLMPAAVFEVVRRELLEADLVRATQTAVGPWATSGRPLGHLWATQWCDKLAGDDAEQSFFTEYSHYIQLCVANEGPTSKKSAKKKATVEGQRRTSHHNGRCWYSRSCAVWYAAWT